MLFGMSSNIFNNIGIACGNVKQFLQIKILVYKSCRELCDFWTVQHCSGSSLLLTLQHFLFFMYVAYSYCSAALMRTLMSAPIYKLDKVIRLREKKKPRQNLNTVIIYQVSIVLHMQ